jgi:hypothetical protein
MDLRPRREFIRTPQQSFDLGARLTQARFDQGNFRGSQTSQLAALLTDPWHSNQLGAAND